MDEDEIRSRFDGRGSVEIRGEVSVRARAEAIARVLGYRLVAIERQQGPNIGLVSPGYRPPARVRLLFRRDDDPRGRRRAELAVERLRAGGSLMPEVEEPPPPPLTPGPLAPRPRRSLEPRPPPPVGPPRLRIPPRPPCPPPPSPPPALSPSEH